MEKYRVKAENSNQRIDKYLRKAFELNVLGSIYKAFRKKDVKVNGKAVKPEYILQPDDEVVVYLQREMGVVPSFEQINRQFKVSFEDENLLIVSKPAGLSVQEDVTTKGFSLARQVLSYLVEKKEYDPEADIFFTPSPVHRIDRNTSGLVIFAKNFATSQEFSSMLKARTNIEKYYLALVNQRIEDKGEINLPLLKNDEKSEVIVSKEGRNARTKYTCLQASEEFSLAEVQIITGRTHQIRVHFAAIGHSLVGDNKYGDYKINDIFAKKYGFSTHFLHAYKLKFYDITGRFSYLNNKEIIAELPEDKKRITAYIFGKK